MLYFQDSNYVAVLPKEIPELVLCCFLFILNILIYIGLITDFPLILQQ